MKFLIFSFRYAICLVWMAAARNAARLPCSLMVVFFPSCPFPYERLGYRYFRINFIKSSNFFIMKYQIIYVIYRVWFVRPISNVCVWTPNPNGRGFCLKKKEEAWLTGSNQPPSGDCTNFLLLNVSAILLIAPSFPIGFNIGCRKMRQRNQTKDTWFVSSRIRYNLSYCRSD